MPVASFGRDIVGIAQTGNGRSTRRRPGKGGMHSTWTKPDGAPIGAHVQRQGAWALMRPKIRAALELTDDQKKNRAG